MIDGFRGDRLTTPTECRRRDGGIIPGMANTARILYIAWLLPLAASAAPIDFKPFPLPSNADTFVLSGLRSAARREILENVALTAYDRPGSWDAELRVRHERVGAWHVAVVRGTSLLCGATGNCQTWVFRLDGKHWNNVIAAGQAPIVDGLSLTRAGRGKPWHLVTRARISAQESQFAEYRFDGRSFERTRCRISAVDPEGLPKGEAREAPCS